MWVRAARSLRKHAAEAAVEQRPASAGRGSRRLARSFWRSRAQQPPPPRDQQDAPQWTVGAWYRRGPAWEVFGTASQAQERYHAIAKRTKVLFSPDGLPLSCSQAPDATGGEVAALVQAFRDAQAARASDAAGQSSGSGDELAASPVSHSPPGDLGVREWSRLARWAMKPVCRVGFKRSTVTYFGAGPLRNKSLCYFDAAVSPGVHGFVALTLDDAPCRQGRDASQIAVVLDLLRRYDAKATFMTVGDFVPGHEEDLAELLRQGHELGNHGFHDRPYHRDDAAEFGQAVEECSDKIRELQRIAGVPEEVKWFRAPHGKYTRTMEGVLEAKGLTNVMCDTYASCPIIQDGKWIGDFLSNQAQHGSIILLHMPERGLREWCLTGLVHLLEGLKRRNLRAVTVGELARLAAVPPPDAL